MTRTISIITATVGAALLIAVPAYGDNWGADQAQRTGSPDLFQLVQEKNGVVDGLSQTTLAQPYPMIEDGFAQAVRDAQALYPQRIGSERTVDPQWLRAERLRGEGLNREHGLGGFAPSTVSTYKDAGERIVEPQYLQAMRARSEGLNRKYNLGEFATVNGYVDANERVTPPTSSTPVSATTSDREVEWPQVGVGFGIGILLILGLGLAMRAAHVPPFAH